ncbi:putative pectin lyase [Delphinella strobiligena]|nr:putative pectin lyase [Delphinella strobiligena]
MKYSALAAATLAVVAKTVSAIGVVGTAEGFAAAVTGGGSATPVYPSTTDELVSYLGDSEERVIVLSKTFDFTETEGTTTSSGCAPWGTASGCQVAIDQNSWCENYEADAPKVSSLTYYKAGVLGITVASHKTLIGEGSKGIIKGKGLRIVSGASNIIIQNIEITEINPEYVWGGDAITINDSDLVWIDHVTTSLIGRQHIVLGTESSGRVSITNCYINGYSSYSATCDNHHYWAMYFTGSNDLVTLKDNYIYYTSGRSPKVQGNTVLHALNNYWYDNSQHAFEISTGGYVVAEANVFQNVVAPVEDGMTGSLFTVPSATEGEACKTYLGHNCLINAFGSSGNFSSSTTDFLSNFSDKTVATPTAASLVVAHVTANAGMGKLSQ